MCVCLNNTNSPVLIFNYAICDGYISGDIISLEAETEAVLCCVIEYISLFYECFIVVKTSLYELV